MLKHICMSNGGSYSNVSTINDENTGDMDTEKLTKILKTHPFIRIKFDGSNTAIVRTAYISSINF